MCQETDSASRHSSILTQSMRQDSLTVYLDLTESMTQRLYISLYKEIKDIVWRLAFG